MSSLIFSACDRRVMMPHSIFMFHDGSMGMDGTVKQFLTEAEQIRLSGKQMREIYVDRMRENSKIWKRKSRAACEKWVRDMMDKKEDVYFNAADAIKNGFADEIFDGNWDRLADKQ